jgi:hypothetical protein
MGIEVVGYKLIGRGDLEKRDEEGGEVKYKSTAYDAARNW